VNKKGIIISIIGIMLVSSLLVVLVHKTNKDYIMYDGMLLALTIDGSPSTKFPDDINSGKYHVNVECDEGVGTFQPVMTVNNTGNNPDTYEMKFTIENIPKEGVSCNIDFITITNDNKSEYVVSNKVQNSATQQTTTNNAGGSDVSYRYNGKDPANYVWFNNEMWRIIGLMPTCTASGCTSSANLVKIIRNDSIGGYAYDASSTTSSSLKGDWGNNTLYKLLNEYYYKKGDANTDTTGKTYCYGYYNSTYQPVPDCNFEEIGISSDNADYYGRMVEEVYWNTGASAYDGTVSAIYKTETATQTVKGHIGLMTASDYGYAGTDYSNAMSGSAFANNSATNWLYDNGYEWTSIQNSSDTYYALFVHGIGGLNRNAAYNGNAVRPVVYLDSNVYIISGNGTEESPYILGM